MSPNRTEAGPQIVRMAEGKARHPALVRILSGGAANGLVSKVESSFEAQTAHSLAGDYGAVGVMRDRILADEPVDLIILTRALIDDLAESGHVDPATIQDIGKVVTGIAVRHGEPIPTVSSAEALRQALLQADALFVPDTVQSTAGRHVAKVLDALGLTDDFKDRLREYPNGQTAMSAMVNEGTPRALGCTQITEILNTPGVDYAGDLPAEHGLSTVYTAALSSKAKVPAAARALIDILTAPEAADRRNESGFS